ncbi:MAG: hypothetical protein AABW83_03750 [Nanoarchaeota archaeon]
MAVCFSINSDIRLTLKRKFLINKKSQAHVEMILATTLFVGFLVFLFIFLRSSSKITKELPIDDVKLTIIKELEENIGKLSVVLNSETNCFDLTDLYDEYGTNFRAVQDSNKKRITIYYGDFFEKNYQPCDPKKKGFKVGVYIEEKIISERNIEKLTADYNSDYSELKQRLGIENFAFEFKDRESNIIERFSVQGKIPQNVDTISESFPVRIINNKAEISELTLNIKVWK